MRKNAGRNRTRGPGRPHAIRLVAGRLRDAVRAYRRQRREFAAIPPGPPILVTGTHRSGTTWVGRMLAVPGVWHLHEPFNPNRGLWREPFSYRRPSEPDRQVDRIARRLLRGGLRRMLNVPHSDHPCMPLRLLGARPARILVKDPLACLLGPYLAQHHGFVPLVIFRHPCGFVASVLRLGWPTGGFLGKLLQQQPLMQDHLEPYRHLLERYQDEDSPAAAAVLTGALNRVLWNAVTARQWNWVTFESLCDDPLTRFKSLFATFSLPYDDTTRAFHESLCLAGSDRPADYHPHAVKRRSRAMATAWRKELSDDVVRRVWNVWREFDIPLYEPAGTVADSSKHSLS